VKRKDCFEPSCQLTLYHHNSKHDKKVKKSIQGLHGQNKICCKYQARWEDMLNVGGISSSENTPHLLIPLPDSPQVVDVQLWLHILLSVEGDEWDLGQK